MEEIKELSTYYADYVRKEHVEPDVKGLNKYLEQLGVDCRVTRGNFSQVREMSFSSNEDLKDLSFNESDFTDEYFDRLEHVLKSGKMFIISTVITGKAAKVDFYRSLLNWAEHNDGYILLLPSTDVAGSHTMFKLNFDPIFKNDRTFIIVNRKNSSDGNLSIDETPDGYYLNKHLWMSCIKTQAKTINPLSGFKPLVTSKDASVILGSPRQELTFNSALKNKVPRALMSTGAVTINNYQNDYVRSCAKSAKAREAHLFGAIVVEIQDENIFHFRQIQSVDGATFTDLDTKYTPDGSMTVAHHATLVMGDTHAGAADEKLTEAILTQLVSFNVIDEVVLHDLCDARPVSPHDVDKLMTNIAKKEQQRHLLERNFEQIVDYLNRLTKYNIRVVVVASNHDEHLNRALENLPNRLKDVNNSQVLIKMASFYSDPENQNKSLLEYCVTHIPKNKLERPELIKWLVTDESYERHGCELGQHGHLGSNGSRGSAKQYSTFVGNAVIGHSHSACIVGKTFQVGTTSELDQGYNKGLSSWTRTCCLVHEDGTKQLINFIRDKDGRYSFKNEMIGWN